jgi:hypothetical protein
MKKTPYPLGHDAAADPVDKSGFAENEAEGSGGRRAVRRWIAGLDEMGMKRPRALSVAQWSAACDRLAGALAYLSAASLAALGEMVIERAEAGERFPSEVRIMNYARSIQAPPPKASQLLAAFMASTAGRAAWRRGPCHAVALMRYLIGRRLPPGVGGWLDIEADAEAAERTILATRARIAASEARPGDASAIAAAAAEAAEAWALVFPSGAEA